MADLNEPYWFEEVPAKKRFPVFTGNFEVDVAVVGGGIAGLTAAYFLSKSGLRVALLDQGFVGAGDSGYTTAFISHFLDNAEDTRKTWTASEEALEIIAGIIKNEKIDCDFKRLGAISFTKNDPNNLKTDYKFLLSSDSSLQFFGKQEASRRATFEIEAAILIKNQAQFHIRKYLLALAQLVQSEGCELFEESKILEIKDGGKTIILERGQIKTLFLINATGYPFHIFEDVSKLLAQYVTYVVGLRFEKPRPFGDYIFWDDEIPYHYFRWVSDSEVILGGEDSAMKINDVKNAHDPHEKLKKFMENLTNRQCEVKHKWQGSIFNTIDNLPYAGRHPTYGENIYFACGFGGNGMTFGTLAGKIMSDLILGKENKFAKLFSFTRL